MNRVSFDPRIRLLWMLSLSLVAVRCFTPIPMLILLFSVIVAWKLSQRCNSLLVLSRKLITVLGFFAIIIALTQGINKGFRFQLADVQQIGLSIVRYYILITSAALLLETTSPTEIMGAFRSMKRGTNPTLWNKMVEGYAFMMGVGFMMLPIVRREIGIVLQVQRARGVEVDKGGRIEQAKKMLRMSLPLMVRLFETAKCCLLALNNYAYSAVRYRTAFRTLQFSYVDWTALGLLAITVGLSYALL